jgi:hypothetical protein
MVMRAVQLPPGVRVVANGRWDHGWGIPFSFSVADSPRVTNDDVPGQFQNGPFYSRPIHPIDIPITTLNRDQVAP